jgi:RimJ/RimL family protein N-acetyltransferase
MKSPSAVVVFWSRLGRLLKIAQNQLRNLSFTEFIETMQKSCFRNDPTLIYATELEPSDATESNRSEEVEIIKGNREFLEQLIEGFHPLPWELQCHRYDGVKDFFLAWNRLEGIQHISWIYYQSDPNRILCLGEREAEVKYALTLPRFRGRGLYPRTLKAICGYLAGRGYRRLFICVHKDNTASIRGIERAGFKRVGQIQLRKIMGLQVSKRFMLQEV